MSFKSGFFNSVNLDRGYTNEELSKIFDGVIEDGVYASIGNMLTVKADGDGMSVYVDTGRAWFHHVWMENDSKMFLQIPDASSVYTRWDAVILEIDSSINVRAATIKVLPGLDDGNRPLLTNNDETKFYQIPLAYVEVKRGVTVITDSDIISTVGTNICPFVTGPLNHGNIDNLLTAWRSDWDAWLENQKTEVLSWYQNLRTQMNDDVAVNLQNQIDALNEKINGPIMSGIERIVVGKDDISDVSRNLKAGDIYFQYLE